MGGVYISRKLFCEYNSLTYRISEYKGIILRRLHWIFGHEKYAKSFDELALPVIVCEHNSLVRRQLGNVDMVLQDNKATNLSLAIPKIKGIVILPGETFSFWKLVGNCTKQKGYRDGVVIKNGKASRGIGGGMCQFTNLIHWLILHSPLTIIEHHHHNNVDLFPDYGRKIPFGTGTSIMYNYLDYQFVNNTKQKFQLIIRMDEKYLYGELRSDMSISTSYHIIEENHYFSKINNEYYRHNEIYRKVYEKDTGNIICNELIVKNHSKVMYDDEFIPREMIRGI